MNLRLASGCDAGEAREELLLGVDVDQRDVERVAEQRDDLLGLARAHQAVVDEHAGQLIADRFVDEDGGDRAVDPARQPANDPAGADLGADLGNLGVAEGAHRPVARATADVAREVGEQLAAVGCVDDLGMEHHRIEAPRLVGRDGIGRAFRAGDDREAVGELFDAVAVAHPHLMLLADMPQAIEQRGRRDDVDVGATEFLVVRGGDETSELVRHRLLAVADGEDGEAGAEEMLGCAGTVFPRHR